ncbi:uncharacterized protein H6S33_006888 [Morchella sextelata]|uniref:uncharacterized protein n=1 Tax=Morchella sextelata TaxID=1174677 RepID=UPI001D046739|nr:uncharacterized protein H6S33_006888 [Morchella sextelata]KAH0604511.1 hypothetical protein H6S33_006888 [Morchella sextelata]
MHPLIPRICVLAAATAAVSVLVNSVVPEPYLDEVFHIPQAQAYCTNRFTVWDPKLTTPAGLYLLSYPLALVTSCTPAALRALNALGVALVLPLVTYQILRLVHPGLPRAAAAHSAVNVALFPLLFFFAGLYYTDVYSTVFVLLSYLCWLQRRTWASAGAGWVALWFRQTNVLWAVFLVVLEGVRALEVAQGEEKTEEPAAAAAVEAVAEESVVKEVTPAVTPIASPGGRRKKRKGRPAVAPPQAPTPPALSRVNSRLAEEEPLQPLVLPQEEVQDGPWTINVQSAPARTSELSQAWSRVLDMASKIRVWNPPFTPSVTAQDFFFSTPVSILLAALQHWTALLVAVLPYLCVLSSFAVFILWNDLSIVLGDKSAHQPTLHIPQLLYFATFTLLTSWPLLLSKSFIAECWADNVGVYITPPRRSARGKRARKLPPGFAPAAATKPVSVSWLMLLRTTCMLAAIVLAVHYNTYLHPYLLADNRHFVFYVFRRSILRHPLVRYALAPVYLVAAWSVLAGLRRGGVVSVVWVWGWGVAVVGTLVGAGLVEARYFVVGWVLWRVHVCGGGEGAGVEKWRRWAETVGFVLVDAGVLWVFLRWGFVWEGEAGVQRFMW